METEAESYLVMRITEKLDEARGATQDSGHRKFHRNKGFTWLCPTKYGPLAGLAASSRRVLCDGRTANNIKRIT